MSTKLSHAKKIPPQPKIAGAGNGASPENFDTPEPGSVWVHKKGTQYIPLAVSSSPDAAKADEFPVTVLYLGPDGKKWTRTMARWYGSMTLQAPARHRPGTLLSLVHVTMLQWRALRASRRTSAT